MDDIKLTKIMLKPQVDLMGQLGCLGVYTIRGDRVNAHIIEFETRNELSDKPHPNDAIGKCAYRQFGGGVLCADSRVSISTEGYGALLTP
jgi:hypothetical protein